MEGKQYKRRFYQPSHVSHKSKELFSCLFCDASSFLDDGEHAGERVGRNKRCKGVLRLDNLMTHIKAKHLKCVHAKGKSLLRMSFTMTGADDSPHGKKGNCAPVDGR